ncbi:MAG TPA: response regulator, partial [Candidatus Edwardsbacteria bacterium]|nr:response regulator [Candidatus Edwardsbacteria bacterium]
MAKTRVLIIDDDRELAGELQGALLFKGYDADCCTDERQARLRARLFKPDVILLDLRMPVKSGFKVAQELRDGGDAAGIPIIGMTGV